MGLKVSESGKGRGVDGVDRQEFINSTSPSSMAQ